MRTHDWERVRALFQSALEQPDELVAVLDARGQLHVRLIALRLVVEELPIGEDAADVGQLLVDAADRRRHARHAERPEEPRPVAQHGSPDAAVELVDLGGHRASAR